MLAPMSEPDLDEVHRRSINHRPEVLRSERCGCFCCLAIYAPADIEEWCDGGETALCPRCGIDAVLGSASGFPITRELLAAMKSRWF